MILEYGRLGRCGPAAAGNQGKINIFKSWTDPFTVQTQASGFNLAKQQNPFLNHEAHESTRKQKQVTPSRR
jgi:hypothetical protein